MPKIPNFSRPLPATYRTNDTPTSSSSDSESPPPPTSMAAPLLLHIPGQIGIAIGNGPGAVGYIPNPPMQQLPMAYQRTVLTPSNPQGIPVNPDGTFYENGNTGVIPPGFELAHIVDLRNWYAGRAADAYVNHIVPGNLPPLLPGAPMAYAHPYPPHLQAQVAVQPVGGGEGPPLSAIISRGRLQALADGQAQHQQQGIMFIPGVGYASTNAQGVVVDYIRPPLHGGYLMYPPAQQFVQFPAPLPLPLPLPIPNPVGHVYPPPIQQVPPHEAGEQAVGEGQAQDVGGQAVYANNPVQVAPPVVPGEQAPAGRVAIPAADPLANVDWRREVNEFADRL